VSAEADRDLTALIVQLDRAKKFVSQGSEEMRRQLAEAAQHLAQNCEAELRRRAEADTADNYSFVLTPEGIRRSSDPLTPALVDLLQAMLDVSPKVQADYYRPVPGHAVERELRFNLTAKIALAALETLDNALPTTAEADAFLDATNGALVGELVWHLSQMLKRVEAIGNAAVENFGK
jgi:hypothetical protein